VSFRIRPITGRIAPPMLVEKSETARRPKTMRVGAAFNRVLLSSPSGRRAAEEGSNGIFALRRPVVRVVLKTLIVELLAALNVIGRAGCKTLRAACRVIIKLRGSLRLLGLSGLAAGGASSQQYSCQ
jgi:hypothetical protein